MKRYRYWLFFLMLFCWMSLNPFSDQANNDWGGTGDNNTTGKVTKFKESPTKDVFGRSL